MRRLRAGVLAGLIAVALVVSLETRAAEEGAQEKRPAIDPELLKLVPQELRYERVELPDEQNAYPLWQQAIEKMVELDHPELERAFRAALDEGSPFPGGDAGERLAEWLDRNREALDLLDKGIARGRCQFPEVLGPDVPLPYLMQLHKLPRTKLLRAKMLAARDEYEDAAQQVAGVFRVGEMTWRGEGGLIHCLVGYRAQFEGLEGARWLVTQHGTTEEIVEDLLTGTAPAAESDPGLAQAIRAEFFTSFVHTLQTAPKDPHLRLRDFLRANSVYLRELLGGTAGAVKRLRKALAEHPTAPNPRGLDKGATLKEAGEYFAQYTQSARKPWHHRYRGSDVDFEKVEKQLKADLAPVIRIVEGKKGSVSKDEIARIEACWLRIDNPAGKLLTFLLLPSFDTAVEESFRLRTERELTRAFLALRLYQMRKGQLPESLDQLVEEGILPSVPVDMFSGEPLRYDPTRRLIWSVGSDEVDDGGEGEAGERRGKDYVFAVPEWL